MSEINFDENNSGNFSRNEYQDESGTTAIGKFLIKLGIIKNPEQEKTILVCISVLCFTITFLVIYFFIF